MTSANDQTAVDNGEHLAPMDLANELYDAVALLGAIRGRVVQITTETDELSTDTGNELDRLLRMAHHQVSIVADGLFDLKLKG